MDETAKHYNLQGLRLVNLGRYAEAIDFFSRAIEIDPDFSSAYKNRGEAYILVNRYVEGNTDIQKAKDIQSGKRKPQKKQKKTARMDIHKVDSIYDTVFPDENTDIVNPDLEFDEDLVNIIFSDNAIDGETTWEETSQAPPGAEAHPAIVEFIGGKCQEVAGAVLFHPSRDTISIVDENGADEQLISLEQLACIRMSAMPKELSSKHKESCYREIIETVDGTIYHEFIDPDQDRDDILFGFSTKEQSPFPFTLFPKQNIKKRCQERLLGEILLEKRYIASHILNNALDEYHRAKEMKIGKIIAQKAQVLYSAIEEELEKANQKQTGLKTGEVLLASGLVNEEHILDSLEYQENIRNLKIGEFLVQKGIVQEKEIYVSLAEKHRFPFIDLRKQKISKQILNYLPRDMVVQHEIIPLAFHSETLVVATHEVDTGNLCEDILKSAKCRHVQFALTQPTHIKNFVNQFYTQ